MHEINRDLIIPMGFEIAMSWMLTIFDRAWYRTGHDRNI